MLKSIQAKIFFQVFITFIFSGFLLSEPQRYVSGVSPYNLAAARFEETAFVKIQKAEQQKLIQAREAKQKIQLNYETKVKEKIRQVIVGYRARMSLEHIQEISKSILEESKKYNYDPMFLTALIITESSFDRKARSHRGALGLMQIIPRTGVALATEKKMEWKGNPSLYNPQVNIALGTYYLNKLQNRFGDLNLALEAYNHGPTKLDKYLKRGHQPRLYSKKVLKIYSMIDFEPI